jgi:hypothetical protein
MTRIFWHSPEYDGIVGAWHVLKDAQDPRRSSRFSHSYQRDQRNVILELCSAASSSSPASSLSASSSFSSSSSSSSLFFHLFLSEFLFGRFA